MVWQIEFSEHARKSFSKIDKSQQKRITKYLVERISSAENPRDFGKPLLGDYKGFWRYRIGDYRVICDIQDKKLVVLVLDLGHRKEIY